MTRDEFLARLAITFGQPDTADEALFIENYEAVIGKTSPRVLDVAFSIIRDEQEFKTWPMPAVVRKAINSASERVYGPPKHEDKNWQNPRANPSPESRRRVDDIVSNALQAMAEKTGDGKPKYPFATVQRQGFEAMQRNSPNRYMHEEPPRSRNGRNG